MTKSATLIRNILIGTILWVAVPSQAATYFGDVGFIESGLSARPDILFFSGYETNPWNSVWGLDWGPSPAGNHTIISGAEAFSGNTARVFYPANTFGTSANGTQYFQNWANFPIAPRDSAYARYYVKFQPGFQFAKGGKLPGFCGAGCNTGCSGIPTGSDGWSARMMWRGNGQIVQYVYHMDQANECGTDFPWTLSGCPVYFKPGEWYCVETYVQMNTIGQANGILRSWLNGQLALEVTNMRWRASSAIQVDHFYFSTFFGGSDATWNSPQDQYAYFDNFVIAQNYVGPMPGPAGTPTFTPSPTPVPGYTTSTLVFDSDNAGWTPSSWSGTFNFDDPAQNHTTGGTQSCRIQYQEGAWGALQLQSPVTITPAGFENIYLWVYPTGCDAVFRVRIRLGGTDVSETVINGGYVGGWRVGQWNLVVVPKTLLNLTNQQFNRILLVANSSVACSAFYVDDVVLGNVSAVLTPTPTRSPTPVLTPSATPTATASNTVTRSPTPTVTSTFTRSSTPTLTRTATATNTVFVPTNTFTITPTFTRTATNTFTLTPTLTRTSTATNTVFVPTNTFTVTPTFTRTATNTFTLTSTLTRTATATNTFTVTSTVTRSPTPTVTTTFTRSSTPTLTRTASATTTFTPSSTPTLSATRTATFTNTFTLSATPSVTSTATRTFTATTTWTGVLPTSTSTPTLTRTHSTTATATTTYSTTLTTTRTPTATATPSFSPSFTATPSVTSTSTRTFTATATWTGVLPTATGTNTLSPTVTRTRTATPSNTTTSTATATASTTATHSMTPSSTPTASPTLTAGLTNTWTFTMTATPTHSVTWTFTVTRTPTPTYTPTLSLTSTSTSTPTRTDTSSPTPTATNTPTRSFTPTLSFTSTFTLPPSTSTPTQSATATSTHSPTRSPTASLTPTLSPSPTWTHTSTRTATVTYTSTAVFTVTWTYTITPTYTYTPTETIAFTWTPTLSSTPNSSFIIPNSTVVPYPNPCTGDCDEVSLNVTMENNGDAVVVQVFTTAFRKISETVRTDLPVGVTPVRISLRDAKDRPLANGLYHLRVVSGGKVALGKLLILR